MKESMYTAVIAEGDMPEMTRRRRRMILCRVLDGDRPSALDEARTYDFADPSADLLENSFLIDSIRR